MKYLYVVYVRTKVFLLAQMAPMLQTGSSVHNFTLGCRLLFFFSIFLTSVFNAAHSQTPADYGWQVGYGYSVGATALKGDTMILGGDFDYIGQYTGSTVSVDINTAKVQESLPVVNGITRVIISDGNGGFFIGGDFTLVDGYKRNGFAHILSNRKLDLAWTTNVDEGKGVYALLLSITKDTLWVGGNFNTIGGLAKKNVAAIKVSTKSVISAWGPGNINANWWAPSIVTALAYYSMPFSRVGDEPRLFIGGDFNNFNWTSFRSNLAALNPRTGAVLNWIGDVKEYTSTKTWSPVSSVVRSLVVFDDFLFVGGLFSGMTDGTGASVARHSIAKINHVTDKLDPTFSASIQPMDETGVINCQKLIKNGSGSTVLAIGGIFSSINYQGWSQTINSPVKSFALLNWGIGDPVAHTGFGTPMSADVLDTTLNSGNYIPAEIFAIETVGTKVILGGDFEGVRGIGSTIEVRRNLVCFEMNGNTILDWKPYIQTNMPVRSMVLSGSELNIAGNFTSAGGALRKNIAAVHPTQNIIYDLNPQPTNYVNDLAFSITKDTLYFAGNFATVGESTVYQRGYIAGIDLRNNTLLPWATITGTGGGVEDIVLDYKNQVLYAGGKFNTMGGVTRRNLAAFNLADGSLISTWIANVQPIDPVAAQTTPVRSLALSPTNDTLFVGGRFDVIEGNSKANLAAIKNKITASAADATATVINTWNFPVTPDANVSDIGVASLLLENGRLYVGGKYDAIGGNSTLKHLSAINISTIPNAIISTWAPKIEYGGIWCMQSYGGRLYLGGDFGTVNGVETSFAAIIRQSDASVVAGWRPFPTIQPFGGVILTLLVNEPHYIYLGGSHRNMTEDVNDEVFHYSTWSGIGIPLAQKIISFSAELKQDECFLNWKIDSENSIVSVEKSLNGRDFYEFVSGLSGLANSVTDHDILPGKNYFYRLKIRSPGGDVSYSAIRMISTKAGSELQFPKLYANNNTLRIICDREALSLKLFSVSGQCVLDKRLNTGLNEIAIDNLRKGIYVYIVNDSKGMETGKLLIN